MKKNALSVTTLVAKDVTHTKAYQLMKDLKKIRDSVPFHGDKNGLDTLNEAVDYFTAITLLFELTQIKKITTHIPIGDAVKARKALLDHPKLQLLINEGLLTPISIEVPALKRLLKVETSGSTYDEIHSYPVLNTNAQGKPYISQCMLGCEAGKEDFENIEDVFDPWPPTITSRPAPNTLDAEIAKLPLEKGKRAPTV